jgi:hypothetical protein
MRDRDHAGIIKAIEHGFKDIGKWLSIQNSSLNAGFDKVAEAIANIQPLPQPQPKSLEVKFMFIVPDDQPDESFAISIGGVTDAEGNALPDASGLTVAVASSDDGVVSVTFDPATNSGTAHFGNPGVASLTASVTNAKGDILGSGAADFTVTTGDPAAVSDVKIAFSGLTEAP